MHIVFTIVALVAVGLVAWFLTQIDHSGGSLTDRFRLAVAGFGSEAGVVTLAQAALNAADDIDRNVVDEFRKSSYLLENLPFDDAVNAAGGGATLTYGYTRLITQPTAAFRAINAEYTPQEVTKQQYTVDLRPFGGSFQIDRVLDSIAQAAETGLQMRQKIKATAAQFHHAAINGDSGVDANAFDGLDLALTGSTTELQAATEADWTVINTQEEAFTAMALLDDLLGLLNGKADAILGNSKSIARVKQIARWAGYRTEAEDAFGRRVEAYDGVALVDLGERPGSTSPIIPIETRDPDGDTTDTTGLTDLYAVRFAIEDGFHGVSRAGQPLIENWLPDFSTAGAVKTGEVEMVAAVALKATKGAAVLRNLKVQ